jgi:hypothetical protein
MFGRSKKTGNQAHHEKNPHPQNTSKGPTAWHVPIFFAIMFALSVAEMCFTIDSFQYLQKKNKWWSGTERARMAFLIFSAARTILLSAVYIGFHFCVKHLHNMLHTVRVVNASFFSCFLLHMEP